MKVPQTENNGPAKYSAGYTDFRRLVVYCLNQGLVKDEEIAYHIFEQEWMAKDSKHRDYKSILKHVKAAYEGAITEVDAVGAGRTKKLSITEKYNKALEYFKAVARYDTLGNRYTLKDTGKEVGPLEIYSRYDEQVDEMSKIEPGYFDRAFESLDVDRYSPIVEWSKNLPKWNKKNNIAALCKFIPAQDPSLLELFLTNWLIRCYIQAVNPFSLTPESIVNRHFLILQSTMEGNGKSSFLNWLCPLQEWYTTTAHYDDKDGLVSLSSYMFIIDDELASTQRVKELELVKKIVSIPKINVRLPYGKRQMQMARTASFCGSSNNDKIFNIGEQNTRFLCVPLLPEMFRYNEYIKLDKDQIWAQVKALAVQNKWLQGNEVRLRDLQKETNKTFEKETTEKDILKIHTRPLLPEDVADSTTKLPAILRVSDVVALIRATAPHKQAQINKFVLAAALKEIYGAPVLGYVVKNLFTIDGNIEKKAYEKTNIKSFGYAILYKEMVLEGGPEVIKKTTKKRPKKRAGQ